MNNDTNETPEKKDYLVFAGQQKEGVFYYLSIESLDENDGKYRAPHQQSFKSYNQSLFKSKIIGGIYEVKYEGTKVVYCPSDRPVGYWKDSEGMAHWRLLDRAIELSAKALREAKANQYEALLRPIRDAYKAAPSSVRAILLAEVVRQITK